jgi:hypothetical protein
MNPPWFHFGNCGSEAGSSSGVGLTIFTNVLNVGQGSGALFVSSASSACRGGNREGEMPSFSNVKYVYDPETLKMMGAAFDTACQSFPPDLKDHERVRRKLALLILRHMDRGERDATRLRDLALLDFTR